MLFIEKKPLVASASATADIPIAPLFALMGEQFAANYKKWSPEVRDLQMLTPPPIRPGTIFRQVRVDHGHKSDSRFTVSAFNPPSVLAFRELNDRYRCSYQLETTGDSDEKTRISFTFEFPDLEPYMRPFEKLVRLAIQEGATKTVDNLKAFSENAYRI